MRDDIHKEVPAPRKFQFWVRLALRPADQLRSYDAMNDAVLDTARREMSARFIIELQQRLTGEVQDLFGSLRDVTDARDIGGKGTPLEQSALNACKRLLFEGLGAPDALKQALVEVLGEQMDAHMRAADVVLRGSSDPRALDGIRQMHADRCRLNLKGLTVSIMDRKVTARAMQSSHVRADENLLSPTFVKERR